MPGRMRLLALAALLLLALAPPARAGTWQRVTVTSAKDQRSWAMSVLPSGIGYAANEVSSLASTARNFTRTTDGGKTWKSLPAPPLSGHGYFEAVGNGDAVLVLASGDEGGSKPLHWSAATNKWTSHTVEAPKNLGGTIKRISISSITTVPRVKQAFAAGDIETTANKAVPCVWHWSGGTAWKATKMNGSTGDLLAASPTAAWMLHQEGKILRWNGTIWVLQRKAAAADDTLEPLQAVAPTKTTPAAVWARLYVNVNGKTGSKLLLCGATGACVEKKAAGAGTYPGDFIKFGAATSKFALVWEQQHSKNPNKTAVHLQQYDGAKWTTKMKVNVQVLTDGPPQGEWQPKIATPYVQVSVASATRAVVMLTHLVPVPANGKPTTATVVTHTWDGKKWTQHTNSTFVRPAYANWQNVQSLNSGSAVRTLGAADSYFSTSNAANGMFRLVV